PQPPRRSDSADGPRCVSAPILLPIRGAQTLPSPGIAPGGLSRDLGPVHRPNHSIRGKTMHVLADIVNAFVDGTDGGNPAGVVVDADGLDSGQKLAIAARLGVSET